MRTRVGIHPVTKDKITIRFFLEFYFHLFYFILFFWGGGFPLYYLASRIKLLDEPSRSNYLLAFAILDLLKPLQNGASGLSNSPDRPATPSWIDLSMNILTLKMTGLKKQASVPLTGLSMKKI